MWLGTKANDNPSARNFPQLKTEIWCSGLPPAGYGAGWSGGRQLCLLVLESGNLALRLLLSVCVLQRSVLAKKFADSLCNLDILL